MAKQSKASKKKAHHVDINTIVESKVFYTAMSIAERVAYSKSKLFRLLQHAFQKLKEESTNHTLSSDFKHKVATLMRMAKAYYTCEYRKMPTTALFRVIGGLLYFVWILDLIPDFIPILGFADDVAVIVWVYKGLTDELAEFEAWESANAVEVEAAGKKG